MARKKDKRFVLTYKEESDSSPPTPENQNDNKGHDEDHNTDETLNSVSTGPASVVSDNDDDLDSNPDKKRKPGIIYLSSIPTQMNVALVRQALQVYGEIGRIFLQPAAFENDKPKKKKPSRSFTEGWVEFKKKRVAKAVAQSLNRQPVGGKRRTQYHDILWNLKYLSGFKWAHLNERLAYEKAVHEQRMRTEIAQAKREANHFVQSVEKSEKMRRLEKKRKAKGIETEEPSPGYVVQQKPTEEEFQRDLKFKRAKKDTEKPDRGSFLQSLFGSGKQATTD